MKVTTTASEDETDKDFYISVGDDGGFVLLVCKDKAFVLSCSTSLYKQGDAIHTSDLIGKMKIPFKGTVTIRCP